MESTKIPLMMWYPKGVKAFIQSRSISGGMIYVGPPGEPLQNMRASSIDPTLPIADPAPGEILERPGRATRYEEFTPAQRSIYLDWLDTGRSNPLYHEQYVYLYLFGIDYRARGLLAGREKHVAGVGTAKLIFEREGPLLRDELTRLSEAHAANPVLRSNIASVLNRLTRALNGEKPNPTSVSREVASEKSPIPPSPAVSTMTPKPPPPRERWYRPGERFRVHERTITTGLFYGGAPDPLIDAQEPSAIDPASPEGAQCATAGKPLAFRDLYQRNQDLYIDWLAEGRPIDSARSWMVEMFLWGLERRVIYEAWYFGLRESWNDLAEIEACLVDMTRSGGHRLAAPEWHETATSLLEMTRILRVLVGQVSPDTIDADPTHFDPVRRAAIYDLSDVPWPEDLALTMLQGGYVPVPAYFKAHRKFSQHFFHLHYEPTVHGRFRGQRGTKEIKFTYRGMSPLLKNERHYGFPNLVEPDLHGGRLAAMIGILKRIELQNPEAAQAIAGEDAAALGLSWQFLLPVEQRSKELRRAVDEFKLTLPVDEPVSMFLSGLMSRLGCNVPRTSPYILRRFVETLAENGVGLEPDPRSLPFHQTSGMVSTPFRCDPFFALDPNALELFGQAIAIINWVAMKLGMVTPDRAAFIRMHTRTAALNEEQRTRLRLQYDAGMHRGPGETKDLAERRPDFNASHLAFINKGVEKLFVICKIEPGSPRRHLAQLANGTLLSLPKIESPADKTIANPPPKRPPVSPPIRTPVEVQISRSGPVGAPAAKTEPVHGANVSPRPKLNLDKKRIREIEEDSDRAAKILAPIFEVQQESEPLIAIISTHPWGLDVHLAAFLIEMAGAVPSSIEFAREIAQRHDLMLDGAIERINEAALENAGDFFFELGDDQVTRTGVEIPT